jgi:hypothetical protein
VGKEEEEEKISQLACQMYFKPTFQHTSTNVRLLEFLYIGGQHACCSAKNMRE